MAPIQIFSTLFICQQLWGMWTIHFYIAFLHICNLRWLYLSAYWSLHIFFVCVCFSSIMGVVIWHARWAPFCHGEAFHWYGSKILFCSMYNSVCSKNIFFNIMNFVGIGSYMIFLFPCQDSIHFYVYMLLSVYMFIFLHIFCLRMVGIDHGWSDIPWQMKPLIFHNRLLQHFCTVDTTLRMWHSTKLTFMYNVCVLLHFTQ